MSRFTVPELLYGAGAMLLPLAIYAALAPIVTRFDKRLDAWLAAKGI